MRKRHVNDAAVSYRLRWDVFVPVNLCHSAGHSQTFWHALLWLADASNLARTPSNDIDLISTARARPSTISGDLHDYVGGQACERPGDETKHKAMHCRG